MTRPPAAGEEARATEPGRATEPDRATEPGRATEPASKSGATEPAAGPRWLTEAEDAAWRNLIRVLVLLPGSLDRQLREDAGIPHVYYHILAMLSEQPERCLRMTDLARLVGTTTSRLSHAVSSLEQRGWVERRACPTDRRGQVAALTPAGMAAVEAAAPGHVAEVRRLIFDRLTADDVRHLREITGKMLPGAGGGCGVDDTGA